MANQLKLLTGYNFTSFGELPCSFWHFWKFKRSFLSNQNNLGIVPVISQFFSKSLHHSFVCSFIGHGWTQLVNIFRALYLNQRGQIMPTHWLCLPNKILYLWKKWKQNLHGLGFKFSISYNSLLTKVALCMIFQKWSEFF